MRRPTCLMMALLAILLSARLAEAHFLFIRIGEPAEAGRTVEVFFSEYAAAGDPRYIAKVAPTTLTLQASPGKFQPLDVHKAEDRLRASIPSSGTVSVAGFLEYGVLKREVSFLLRYYPKAVAGNPADLAKLKPAAKAPLEIDVAFEGDGATFKLLRDGKPLPAVKFTTVDDDLVNEEFTADEKGAASWKPPSPGYYCVYARSDVKQAGEHQGTKYTEIREFATVSFRWPLERKDGDSDAVALFEQALAARATWKEFPGFDGEVAGTVDGRSFDGKLSVAAAGDVKIDLGDEPVRDWVEAQIRSMVMHRLPPRDQAKPNVLRFADIDQAHPLGRLLTFDGGEFASSYRVRGDEITVVNRNFGGSNMTITILDSQRNAEKKQLPGHFTVQYWNDKDGSLDRTESYSHRWTRVGSFDLPASVIVTTASNAGLSVKQIEFKNLQLRPARKTGAN